MSGSSAPLRLELPFLSLGHLRGTAGSLIDSDRDTLHSAILCQPASATGARSTRSNRGAAGPNTERPRREPDADARAAVATGACAPATAWATLATVPAVGRQKR